MPTTVLGMTMMKVLMIPVSTMLFPVDIVYVVNRLPKARKESSSNLGNQINGMCVATACDALKAVMTMT